MAIGFAEGVSTPTIIVVDDEALIREAVTDHLRNCGFHVLEAGDAEEAIEIMEASVEIDIVFSDIRMPGMGGVALAKWVLKNRPGIPLFLASGNMGRAYAAHELFGARFFQKSYALSMITETFHAAVQARRRSQRRDSDPASSNF